MHGRLKVKSTAEQEAAKQKERAKKMAKYLGATKLVFDKREKGEMDKQVLEVSGELLAANSDFYTLWNLRREVFIKLKDQHTPDEMNELYKTDLSFLEFALKNNPKSYGCWQHRCWIMNNIPDPDWSRELTLCNKFLELDERNFHCWDYRRFVVKSSSVSLEDELKYTTQKIEADFSNYSSWHYRSKLLPVVHADQSTHAGVEDTVLMKEFELAQNAFFTDPNDQSAWFYHRWLLGKGEIKLECQSIHVSRPLTRIVVTTSKAVKVDSGYPLLVKINEEAIKAEAQLVTSGSQFSEIVVYDVSGELPENEEFTVTVTLGDVSRSVDVDKGKCDAYWRDEIKPGQISSVELSAATESTLVQELDACQQLVDLEPDNKWVLITIVSLMRALDPLKHQKETIEYTDKLIKIDPGRTNYYLDLRSKFIVENALETMSNDNLELTLTNLGLSVIYHLDKLSLFTKINLSNNKIFHLKNFHFLQCCKELNLDDNNLESTEGLSGLICLKELSIQNNKIESLNDLDYLKCTNLCIINLEGNPICDNNEFITELKTLIPSLQKVNGANV